MLTSKGFTLVELIIVITVSGILSGLLFGPLNDLYNSNVNGLQIVVQTSDTRAALRSIEKEISSSLAFASTNIPSGNISGAVDPENNAVAGCSGPTTWYWKSGTACTRVAKLITVNYMTAKDSSNNRTLAYTPATCDDYINSPKPIYTNVIYFINNNALYRRTLLQSTSTCAGFTIDQKQSCSNPSVTSSCSATDAKIVDNVSDFSVDYYTDSDTASKNTATDDTVPGSSKTLMLKLKTFAGVGSNTTYATSTLRITRINQYDQ